MIQPPSIQMHFVKKPPKNTGPDIQKTPVISTEQVKTLVMIGVGAVATIKVVDALCTIAINLTNPVSWK